LEIADKHAPFKERIIKPKQVKIIEDFTYFFLICDDIIIFLKYYIFLVGASFVGKERLHSEP
jgi:hypothetical protein